MLIFSAGPEELLDVCVDHSPHPARILRMACHSLSGFRPADPSHLSQQLAEPLDGLYRIVIGFSAVSPALEAAGRSGTATPNAAVAVPGSMAIVLM